MHCPYCNKEMELGVIQSQHEINWSPKKHLFGAAMLHEDAVVLAEHSFMRGSDVNANLCRSCKTVIIRYDD